MTRIVLAVAVLVVIAILPALLGGDPTSQNLSAARAPASWTAKPTAQQAEILIAEAVIAVGGTPRAISIDGQDFAVVLRDALSDDPALTEFLDRRDPRLTWWRLDADGGLAGRIEPMRHLLGTDGLGRDQLTRLLHGLRMTASFAGMVTLLVITAGAILGLLAALSPRWLDEVVMRSLEAVYAFPVFLIVVLGTLYLGVSVAALALLIALIELPDATRFTRGAALRVRVEEYVRAARALGLSTTQLAWRHLFPAILSLLPPYGAIVFARAVAIESALSFLALGFQEPQITLGLFLAEASAQMEARPLPLLVATGFLVLLVLIVLILGQTGRQGRPERML